MWKAIETKSGKVRIAETEGEGGKRRGK